MKQLFIVGFILSGLTTSGQTCDTLDGQILNCVDSHGLKQGCWQHQKETLLYSASGGFGSPAGCQTVNHFKHQTLAEGRYKDDYKIGAWKYYAYPNYTRIDSVEKVITYFEGGAVLENNLSNHFKIFINQDSTVISGELIRGMDMIRVACADKRCVFELQPAKTILAFDFPGFNTFDFERFRLQQGAYDQPIRQIKERL